MLQCSWLFSARNLLASKYFLTNKFIYSIYIPCPVRCVNLASVVVHVQAISMACSQGLSTCLNHYLPPSSTAVVRCALHTWSTSFSCCLYVFHGSVLYTHSPHRLSLLPSLSLCSLYVFQSAGPLVYLYPFPRFSLMSFPQNNHFCIRSLACFNF